jgi:AbiV family abortive infection protein
MLQKEEEQLTADDLRDAGIKSFENASELVEEAQLLFEHRHWGRAVFLCCISGEELGKCFISLSAVVNRRSGAFDERRYKQRLRDHREKAASLNLFEDIFVSSSDVPVLASEIGADTDVIGKVKVASWYCDFYGVRPHRPSELIPEQLASGILKLAKNRVEHFSEQVRPKFDQVLQIDPAEIIQLRNALLGSRNADAEPEADS